MADLMLFPPSWYSGPEDPPEPPEVDEVEPVNLETCIHHEGPDCEECTT